MLSTALAHAAGHGKPASPVADAGAVVRFGNARFTVLTDRLVRMEWAADGRFEDRASLAFINRRLPVPHYTQEHQDGALELRTACLALRYHLSGDGKLTAENLSVDVTCGTVRPHWVPGQADDANLLGTTRTLDGSNGAKLKEPMEQGLVSRSGWSVVDDSSRPLFDRDFPAEKAGSGIGTSPLSWPWAVARPEGARQDLYFFGYGHDYRAALADFTRVAGKIPLPPKFAFGVWWSRYWAYSDQDLLGMVSAFAQHALPLDVVVVD
ncbi:MAG: TIM-barrel domain-containing protein, partial [Gluconobacter oxydans]|uniref:TIM-barrel domain-containing protein n=1 Tax=Gluconobacter oxydans TaxID=442 RepID=UPI0039ED2232